MTLADLLQTPKSFDQLAQELGVSKATVARYVHDAREVGSADGWPFIAGYGMDARGRRFTPLWAWGREPDAQRPGNTSSAAERMRRMRQRKREMKE